MDGTTSSSDSIDLSEIEDHLLLFGYSDIIQPVIEEVAGKIEVVLITDADHQLELEGDPMEFTLIPKDPSDEEVLAEAGIDTARAVIVATGDDGENVLLIQMIRKQNPNVRLLTVVHDRTHADKLASVGADEVINPTELAGQLLVHSIHGHEISNSF